MTASLDDRSDIRVRSPEIADAAAIARTHIRAWQVGYRTLMSASFLDGLDEPTGAARWERRLTDAARGDGEPGVEFLVAEVLPALPSPPDLVGIATLGPDRALGRASGEPAPTGEVWMINVRPDAWGRGVGSALLAAAVDRLRRVGYDELVLWVLRDNHRARRFYETNGWTADGGTKSETTGGALLDELRYRFRGEPASGPAARDQA